MKNRLLILSLLVATCGIASAQQQQPGEPGPGTSLVAFRFVPGEDMFYIPWGGNDAELDRLYALVDEYRAEITAGRMPIYVDGHCAGKVAEPVDYAGDNLKIAAIRANRVKSELITRKGLVEDNFITKNHATAYTAPDGRSYRDMVVVTLRIPAGKVPEPGSHADDGQPEVVVREIPDIPVVEEEPAVEKRPESVAELLPERTAPKYSRWSVGANIGIPFFRGDMNSLSADKTYIGVSAGLQATYQISPLLGGSLSFDWAQNKVGACDYAKGYLLDGSGMTWYTPQSIATQAYGDLYSKINMLSVGLHLDVNVLWLFGPRVANRRFKVIVSPAVYVQHFRSKVYTKSDDKVYVGDRLSKDLSFGLGGDLALRYAVSPAIDLQLKGTGVWITDNLFDNIRTVGHAKQNAMWGTSAGIVWKIGGQRNTNLLYEKK